MAKAITINEFKENKEASLAFIAEALRANPSYEDGQYYFHFTADDGEITAYNNYRDAEITVTAAISVEDMCDAAGMKHDADLGDILGEFEETARFNEIVEEIYDAVIMKELNDIKRYLVISEKAESRTTDVINEAMNEGLQNGSYTVLAEVETIEDARKILSKHKIRPEKNGKRYESYLVYVEEQEYNESLEEWESTGTYEFAEVVTDDDEE